MLSILGKDVYVSKHNKDFITKDLKINVGYEDPNSDFAGFLKTFNKIYSFSAFIKRRKAYFMLQLILLMNCKTQPDNILRAARPNLGKLQTYAGLSF